MSKLTKTQINRVQERLEEIKKKKMKLVRRELPSPTDHSIDLNKAGFEWARNHPADFVKLCEREYANNPYTEVAVVLHRTPAAKEGAKKKQQQREKNEDRLQEAANVLDAEITKILDKLYFGDSADAVAAIEAFEKITVE